MFNFNDLIKRIFSRRRSHYIQNREVARKLINTKLKHFAPLCGVSYKKVSIRNQKSRWGSCSSRGNLNFNYRLIFLPEPLCDYVIVHELCHLKEMNHGPAFWAEVEKVMPDYEARVIELKKIEKSRGRDLKLQDYATTEYLETNLL